MSMRPIVSGKIHLIKALFQEKLTNNTSKISGNVGLTIQKVSNVQRIMTPSSAQPVTKENNTTPHHRRPISTEFLRARDAIAKTLVITPGLRIPPSVLLNKKQGAKTPNNNASEKRHVFTPVTLNNGLIPPPPPLPSGEQLANTQRKTAHTSSAQSALPAREILYRKPQVSQNQGKLMADMQTHPLFKKRILFS